MSTPQVDSYLRLREQIQATLTEGKLRAQQAVERERLTTYHEVGRLINAHLETEGGSARFGDRLFEQLAEDLGIVKQLLHDAVNLYRWHPIVHARGQLGWTHYRILLRLPSSEDRNQLEAEAAKNRWPTRELERQVRQRLPATPPNPEPSPSSLPPLNPLRGLIDVCRVVDLKSDGGRVLDLGFTLYHPPGEIGIETLPSCTVRLERLGPTRYTVRSTRSKKALHYSYLARLERIIDGDTLLLQIHTPVESIVRQRVRLRGIDTPEMSTPGGERAKAFVEVKRLSTTVTSPVSSA